MGYNSKYWLLYGLLWLFAVSISLIGWLAVFYLFSKLLEFIA